MLMNGGLATINGPREYSAFSEFTIEPAMVAEPTPVKMREEPQGRRTCLTSREPTTEFGS